jgi:hypothetical protein
METLSALQHDTEGAMSYRLAELAAGSDMTTERMDLALGRAASLDGALPGLVGVADVARNGETVVIGTASGILRWTIGAQRPDEIPIRAETRALSMLDRPSVELGTAEAAVLCLSPDGATAVVALFGESADSLAADKAGVKEPLRRNSSTLVLVDTASGALRPGVPRRKLPSPATAAAPLGSLGDLRGLRAAFSRDARHIVVIDRGDPTTGRAMVFDSSFSTEGSLVDVPGRTVTDASFVNADVLAIASQATSPLASQDVTAVDVSEISLWRRNSGWVREHWTERRLVLPSPASLITDERKGVFAMVDGEWRWVAESGISTAPLALPKPPGVTIIVPTAFDAERNVLVTRDIPGRLFLSAGDATDPAKFETLAFSSGGALPYSAERKVTPAGVAGLRAGSIATIDDSGTTVRLWKLPQALAVQRPVEAPAIQSAPELKDDTLRSVDGQWIADVRDQAISLVSSKDRSKKGGPWTVPQGFKGPARGFASTSGTRIAVIAPDGIWYGGPADKALYQFAKDPVQDVAFGPGEALLTVRSQAPHVRVYRPSREKGRSDGEWSARVPPSTFLVHAVDESAVVLYSEFWIHRLMAGDGRNDGWPEIVSVFQEFPITSAVPQDGTRNARVFINGQQPPIDFDAEERRVQALTWPWYSPWRLIPRHIRMCDAEGSTATKPDVADRCRWELRTRRLLGTPFTK